MEDQFIPYELAVKLKYLGFEEDCLMHYEEDDKRLVFIVKGLYCDLIAPLWQQAFDWFREKYSLEGYTGLCNFNDMTYGYNITTYIDKSHYLAQGRNYKSYEEARVACLEKLIELCQKE